MMTLRICPKRDAVCPHGMDCQFVIDRFNCKDEQDSPVTPAPVGEVDEDQPRISFEQLTVKAIAAVTALDDWTNENETAFTGWGDGDIPAGATLWRVRSGQALAALQALSKPDAVKAPPSDTSGEAVAQQWIPVDYAEAHPLGKRFSASALAAAEARGVQIGLERAAYEAKLHGGWDINTPRFGAINRARNRQAQKIAEAIRSLSPAHKGSENV